MTSHLIGLAGDRKLHEKTPIEEALLNGRRAREEIRNCFCATTGRPQLHPRLAWKPSTNTSIQEIRIVFPNGA